MSDRVWTVAGFEAGEKVFERTIPVDAIAESDVKGLLQRLAARGLSEEDVVSRLARVGPPQRRRSALDELDGDAFGFTTSQAAGRYYVATLGETE